MATKKLTVKSTKKALPKANPRKKVKPKTVNTPTNVVGTLTNPTNAVNATNTNSSQPSATGSKIAYHAAFTLTPNNHAIVTAIGKVVNQLPGATMQQTNNAVNWATSNSNGTPNCRFGGIYIHGGVCCLQIRFMHTTTLAYAKKHSLQVYGVGPNPTIKCNRIHITANQTQHAIAMLTLQCKAWQNGSYTARQGNVNNATT